MRRYLAPAVIPAVLLGSMLLAGACSSAPVARPVAGPSVVGSPADRSPRAVVGGAVHLTAYTDNDGPDARVILAGAVGDYGTAQSVNPDGSVDPSHRHQLNLMLTHGSFRLDIADIDRKFTAILAATDNATCSGTTSVTAAVPIVAASGTGSYVHISGSFDLTMTLDEVYTPSHCDATGAYLAQSIVITGPGSVAIG
jgi:hypothetical protein